MSIEEALDEADTALEWAAGAMTRHRELIAGLRRAHTEGLITDSYLLDHLAGIADTAADVATGAVRRLAIYLRGEAGGLTSGNQQGKVIS